MEKTRPEQKGRKGEVLVEKLRNVFEQCNIQSPQEAMSPITGDERAAMMPPSLQMLTQTFENLLHLSFSPS